MPTVEQILDLAAFPFERFAPAGAAAVYITQGNQLIGTYKVLCRFRASTEDYRGWQAHHVLETQDLDRLAIAAASPSRDDQLCVLLPERAHIGRINSMLRRHAPMGVTMSPRDLLAAYAEAYELMGDYCGGGEKLIRTELLAIVRATLHAFRLI
jgi:hypothetical protein